MSAPRAEAPSADLDRTTPSMRWDGRVAFIFIAPVTGAPMISRTEVLAVKGRGLEGDRYFFNAGAVSQRPGYITEVTVAEYEVLEELRQRHGTRLEVWDLRRNIITRGIALNQLVGCSFGLGTAILEGVSLCEPCAHLDRVIGRSLLRALVHRAGLRARILQGGTIKTGDAVSTRFF